MTSCTRQFKMRHRSLIVVVFKGLLLRSLSIVELKDLEEYVLAEGDAFSALMRKFATMDSVDGTITPSEVDITVPDLTVTINELQIRPEIFGGMLAMLDMYDYTWLGDNEPKLLQFTDTGFTYHWEAIMEYTLDLA